MAHPNLPPPPADDSLFEAAEDWAGRRPTKALVLEIVVRLWQLGGLHLIEKEKLDRVCDHLGLDAEGKVPQPPERAVPPPVSYGEKTVCEKCGKTLPGAFDRKGKTPCCGAVAVGVVDLNSREEG